jgi:hypothetical protein
MVAGPARAAQIMTFPDFLGMDVSPYFLRSDISSEQLSAFSFSGEDSSALR